MTPKPSPQGSTTSTTDNTSLSITPPLNPAQKASIQAINAKYQPQIDAAKQNYLASLQALEGLIGTNPTDDTIRSKYEQAKDARGELTDLLLDRALEVRGVLTPQQRASLADDIRRLLEQQ
jgi:Spy/CpxP family protein refolding chaperone